MKRATNNCGWLMRNRKENCGKRCVDEYCKHNNYQLNKGEKMPTPCRGCGVGVLCDSCICLSCGGSSFKKRLNRERKKAKKIFELVMLELKAVQLEKCVIPQELWTLPKSKGLKGSLKPCVKRSFFEENQPAEEIVSQSLFIHGKKIHQV